jgi:NAD(P)-dependent dehydrogenase (short-subunit alcohol dehydrogenase family)
MVTKVALILGYGPNVGVDVAKAFAAQGYKIAIASRTNKNSGAEKGYLQIQCDLSDPSSVEGVFSKVTTELGHPSVVIYNGLLHFPCEADSASKRKRKANILWSLIS